MVLLQVSPLVPNTQRPHDVGVAFSQGCPAPALRPALPWCSAPGCFSWKRIKLTGGWSAKTHGKAQSWAWKPASSQGTWGGRAWARSLARKSGEGCCPGSFPQEHLTGEPALAPGGDKGTPGPGLLCRGRHNEEFPPTQEGCPKSGNSSLFP